MLLRTVYKSNMRFYLTRRHFLFQSIISLMMANPNNDLVLLRAQIAARAARLVAQDGADYGTAKRKALRQVLGEDQAPANLLPDNAEVEEEVRKYQALFLADRQPARLRQLRTLASEVMQQLAQFRPYLTGAALNGTAGEHDDVHLQLFADSAKDVIMFLIDRDVQLEISETPHFKGGRHAPVETVSFHWRKQQVHAELYEMNDLRGALKPRPDGRPQRADLNTVRALLDAPDSSLETGKQ
ncbi:MAG: hypothetical protein JWP34_2380 [Massilia sp.]|jgi:hypothetical protein|nr:hypothetical protein [Massilia sp.]